MLIFFLIEKYDFEDDTNHKVDGGFDDENTHELIFSRRDLFFLLN